MSFPLSCILSSYYSSLSLSFPTFSPLSPSLHSLRSGLRRAVVPDPPPRVEGGEGHCGPPRPDPAATDATPHALWRRRGGKAVPARIRWWRWEKLDGEETLLEFRFWGIFFFKFLHADNISTRTRNSDFSCTGALPAWKIAIFAYTFGQTGNSTAWKIGFDHLEKKTFLVVVTLFFYKVRKFKEVWLRKIKS